MPDDGEFESRLRDALGRATADVPLRIDADTVRDRIGRSRRMPGWLVPLVMPVGVAVLIGVILLNAFPGPTDGPGASAPGPSGSPVSEPSVDRIAQPTPAATPHPGERTDAASATADGRLFLIGGTGPRGPLASVVVFNGLIWTNLPSLPEPRDGAGAVLLPDGRLIVAGGERDGQPLDSTLILEPDATAWTDGPRMPHAQAFMGSAAIHGRVYLFGGSVADHADEVLIFDPDAGAWGLGEPMPVAASRVAIATLDGFAYAFGGRSEPDGTNLATTLRYDVTANRWDALTDMPAVGSAMSATVVEARIWIIGAENADFRFGPLLVYEPASDAWTARTDQRARVGAWHAAMLQTNGLILLIGGSSSFIVGTVDTRAPPP
jgi:hypothetical protein